jgi:hypothetical protein
VQNTTVGYQAGYSTTSNSNIGVGYLSCYGTATGGNNVCVGNSAGYALTSGGSNTLIGNSTGSGLTTGSGNTFVGNNNSTACGYLITSGSNNTIIGGFSGNQGGLNITTSSNYIVLSDGSGNPRGIFDNNGNLGVGTNPFASWHTFAQNSTSGSCGLYFWNSNTSAGGNGFTSSIASGLSAGAYLFYGVASATSNPNSGTPVFIVKANGNVVNYNNSYGAISDAKLKQNVTLADSQWNDVKALGALVKKYSLISDPTNTIQIGWIAQDAKTISPGIVYSTPDKDAEGNLTGTETLGIHYSVAYMKAFKALSEALVRIEALEAKLKAANVAGF